MRAIFIGSVKISERCLKKLIELEVNIVGVFGSSKPERNADYCDLSGISKIYDLNFMAVDDLNVPAMIASIRELNPDVIFCIGWSRILGSELLQIPKYGVIGYHPSALPKNRGRHPIIWALALGLKSTASTFFIMNAGVDSGDIISQKKIAINALDDAQSLYKKIINSALIQLKEIITKMRLGKLNPIIQDEQFASYWRKRNYADGQIDWRMSADSIYNLVRALAEPYCGAHAIVRGCEVKINSAAVVKTNDNVSEPGKVLKKSKNKLVIKCGHGAISIDSKLFSTFNLNVGDYL